MTHTRGEVNQFPGEHGTHKGGGYHHPDHQHNHHRPSATEKDKTIHGEETGRLLQHPEEATGGGLQLKYSAPLLICIELLFEKIFN